MAERHEGRGLGRKLATTTDLTTSKVPAIYSPDINAVVHNYIILYTCCGTYNIHAESVDSISRDERDAPLTQYITNAGISRARYTITHFKHHHRDLRLISNRMSV